MDNKEIAYFFEKVPYFVDKYCMKKKECKVKKIEGSRMKIDELFVLGEVSRVDGGVVVFCRCESENNLFFGKEMYV